MSTLELSLLRQRNLLAESERRWRTLALSAIAMMVAFLIMLIGSAK